MNIIVDENIPYGADAFGTIGNVTTMSGRSMTAETVRDADALIVRSVTKVNNKLLGDSRVRFVATATIGTDHIDTDYLAQRGIGFASAPGSNANSVAEYVTAAMLVLSRRKATALAGKTIGVIGVGNVGSRVVKKAEALGMRVLQNDPPLKRKTGKDRFRPIEELFEADYITLHVPLTQEGQDKTLHLADEAFIAKMKKESVLINSSRGAVVNGSELLRSIESHHLGGVVLDVWEEEPAIDPDLLRRVDLASPHIAGYSFDGKVAGTRMVYESACKFFREKPTWKPENVMPPSAVPTLNLYGHAINEEDLLLEAVKSVYDIEADDRRLRRLLDLAPDEQGPYFDRLRKEYPVRREFFNTEVNLTHRTPSAEAKLTGIGFKIGNCDAVQ